MIFCALAFDALGWYATGYLGALLDLGAKWLMLQPQLQLEEEKKVHVPSPWNADFSAFFCLGSRLQVSNAVSPSGEAA